MSTAHRQFGLSKSKISAFEQCPRRLWLQTHRPDLALVDGEAQARFDAGNLVGEIACAACPAGVMVEAEPNLSAAIDTTRQLLAGEPRPIFEGTFSHDGVLVRADIMEPGAKGAWHVAEVKSSTGPKDYHTGDLATQIWVMEQCGVDIASASIRHLNRAFVLARPGDYDGLFMDAELSTEIRPIVERRAETIAEARATLAGDEPDRATGAHCSDPFPCEYHHWCARHDPAPPEWPIALLPNTGAKLAAYWAESGIEDLRDLPDDAPLSPIHARIREVTISGDPFIDRDAIGRATACWAWPRIWIDFETIAFPVPRWIGTKPWQQVPFQFSAHIEYQDGRVDHVEALDLSGEDPRVLIARQLAALPAKGAVIAWNAPFERRCFRELATAIPEHAEALLNLERRTVDLLPVARSHYYHRDQRGSWSIKAVLPTLAAELDYGSLEVKDGGNAQLAYMEATSPACASGRRQAIAAALKAYCARDTWAMIAVYRGMLGQGVGRP